MAFQLVPKSQKFKTQWAWACVLRCGIWKAPRYVIIAHTKARVRLVIIVHIESWKIESCNMTHVPQPCLFRTGWSGIPKPFCCCPMKIAKRSPKDHFYDIKGHFHDIKGHFHDIKGHVKLTVAVIQITVTVAVWSFISRNTMQNSDSGSPGGMRERNS
jgi:hypothetical protein